MGELRRTVLSRPGALAVASLACVVHVLHTLLGVGGDGRVLGDVLYAALVLAAAGACLVRAHEVKLEREAWWWLGAALAALGVGAVVSSVSGAPFPNAGDALALAFYPAAVMALVTFVRTRATDRPLMSALLDGAVGSLAGIAVAAALQFHVARDRAVDAFSFSPELAYLVGDMLVIGAVPLAFAIASWRPGRAWLLAGAGLATAALVDVGQLHDGAALGSRHDALTALAPAYALLVLDAALEPPDPNERFRPVHWRSLVVPIAFAMLATGVLVLNEVATSGAAAFTFAALALAAATVRPALGFRENIRTLTRSQREALTDALTGLSNRRQLMADLRELVKAVEGGPQRILILFDLDGFKQYNDTFGHPAGDALLARLGSNLKKTVGPYGGVYRMGGDEFCVLLNVGLSSARTLTSMAAAALSERGEGFSIRASFGAAMLPQEAREPALALKIADQRMYAQKEKRRPSTSRQTRDLLLQILRERDPELSDHMSAVGELARRVCQKLKLVPEELDETVRAAELHDIGKMAIPDAILHKAGPLDEHEWEFVHKHTIVGERILSAAPALVPVAKIVRASHERWNGTGYPDGLTGESIPVGSRVVSVCDAYHAMTSARPYGVTLNAEEALEEIQKGAGTEFDPRVISALAEVIVQEKAKVPPGANGPAPLKGGRPSGQTAASRQVGEPPTQRRA